MIFNHGKHLCYSVKYIDRDHEVIRIYAKVPERKLPDIVEQLIVHGVPFEASRLRYQGWAEIIVYIDVGGVCTEYTSKIIEIYQSWAEKYRKELVNCNVRSP